MVIFLWIMINIIFWYAFLFCYNCFDDIGLSFINPSVIYNKIKVNWFGAWLLAIVFNVVLPSAAIGYWIYKICTVGRK